MICCLPGMPEYSWVSRIDWMISRILRSYFEPANALSGSRRFRTSCWVIVEAPRSRPPVTVSMAAETMPTGSKPALLQKVLSSIDVVASTSAGESWAKSSMTWRWTWPNRASSTLPVRS